MDSLPTRPPVALPGFSLLIRIAALAAGFAILQGCATDALRRGASTMPAEYLRSSKHCLESSLLKEKVLVPCGPAMTTVEITLSYDSSAFGACMEYAGFPSPKAEPEQYLAVARRCLSESQGASRPETAYANCVHGTGIGVDVEIGTDLQ